MMSKKLTEGCFLYISKMEGLEDLESQLKTRAKNLFKDIYVSGVGIKKIDKIEGNVITFNDGYKAIDDYVVYEAYNDEVSILTTIKKIDSNNFKCDSDLSTLKGTASFRIPPIGLKLVGTSEDDGDIYQRPGGGVFILSNNGILVQQSTDSEQEWLYQSFTDTEIIFVSKNEVIFPPNGCIGFTSDGYAFSSTGTYAITKVSTIDNGGNVKESDSDNLFLFPVCYSDLNLNSTFSNNKLMISKSLAISKCFAGKHASEIGNLRRLSTNERVAAFFTEDYYEQTIEFIHSENEILAASHGKGSQNGVCVKLAELI